MLVAIGFYGIFAYSTKAHPPLVNAYLDVSWRWMYWAYVPWPDCCGSYVPVHPPGSATETDAYADRLAGGGHCLRGLGCGDHLCLCLVSQVGRLVVNEFTVTAALCVGLPVFLAAWLGSGFSPDEHLKRISALRSRVYVLCLTTRGLMLLHLAVAVLTIVGMYCTEQRLPTDYGWLADGADLIDDGDDTFLRPGSTAGRCGTSG